VGAAPLVARGGASLDLVSEDIAMDRYQAEQEINRQLDPGEGLLWSGSPEPMRMALSAMPATALGIPFTGFAAFWIYMAYTMTSKSPAPGPWSLFPLFGLPFLFIGLGMLTSPLWAFLAAGRVLYAVTNRRALIVGQFFSTKVQSFPHADIHELESVERAGGSGDLYFGSRAVVTRSGGVRIQRIGFIGIPDVRGVEQLIRSRLQQDAA
jgi:hypothetical protein